MEQEEPLIGLILRSRRDKATLLKICIDQDIPIPHPRLFGDGTYHRFWAFNRHGIGLVGTAVMRSLKWVLHDIDELRIYFMFGEIVFEENE